jgi:hypothetical protein
MPNCNLPRRLRIQNDEDYATRKANLPEITMQPTDETLPALLCSRDHAAVRPDAPQCLHPSSFCDLRHCCQVLEAARQSSRNPRQDDQE